MTDEINTEGEASRPWERYSKPELREMSDEELLAIGMKRTDKQNHLPEYDRCISDSRGHVRVQAIDPNREWGRKKGSVSTIPGQKRLKEEFRKMGISAVRRLFDQGASDEDGKIRMAANKAVVTFWQSAEKEDLYESIYEDTETGEKTNMKTDKQTGNVVSLLSTTYEG